MPAWIRGPCTGTTATPSTRSPSHTSSFSSGWCWRTSTFFGRNSRPSAKGAPPRSTRRGVDRRHGDSRGSRVMSGGNTERGSERPMRALGLLYHDVVEGDDFNASGFGGADADRYKLDVTEFAKHLRAIAHVNQGKTATALDLLRAKAAAEPLLMLTFDDGGSSAYTHTADLLEQFGLLGHFLVTTNRIGTPAFMTGEQI